MNLWPFRKTGPTASEIGRLGNAVRRERERVAKRKFHETMRARLGLEPWKWTA